MKQIFSGSNEWNTENCKPGPGREDEWGEKTDTKQMNEWINVQ